MRRLTVSVAVLSLALLAACGSHADDAAAPAGAAAPPAAGDSGTRAADYDAASVKVESSIADCMKKAGFRYVAHPTRVDETDQRALYGGPQSLLQPDEKVQAFRAKYGFGLFAALVYPTDPAVGASPTDAGPNPNNAIRDGLDKAQQAAYDQALNGAGGESKAGGESTTSSGCAPTAAQKYFGSGPSKDQQAAAARNYAAFQNDPQVVAAAQKYADCLRGKGYPVASASPGTIEQSVQGSYFDKVSQGGTPGAAAAKTGLTNEIKAALDDLGCRTDYAKLARTRYAAVIQAGTGNG